MHNSQEIYKANKQTNKQTNERMNKQRNETERTNERTNNNLVIKSKTMIQKISAKVSLTSFVHSEGQ